MKRTTTSLLILLALASAGCGDGEATAPPDSASWMATAHAGAAALMGVHGTTESDVWMSGADDGKGPLVLHFDGRSWERKSTGVRGELWWVHAVAGGPVFFGGSEALFLRYDAGVFERLSTPGLGKHTVYGIWAAAEDDVYAVGAAAGRNGFVWHFDGAEVSEVALPDDLPSDAFRDTPGLFKVWGSSTDEVWAVGGRGLVLYGNARDGFEVARTGGVETLFTVHANADKVAIVGGTSSGLWLEGSRGALVERTPKNAPLLQGVNVAADGTVWAVGYGGSVYRSRGDGVEPVDIGLDDVGATQSLHAVWTDPKGGVWTAGGDVLTPELDQGVALHLGPAVGTLDVVPDPPPPLSCPEAAVDPAPHGSLARRWNEQVLNAIRRDTPRPTVHARNLFHLSVAMWDAWSAYDADADGYVVNEKLESDDADAARGEAISYAALRVLTHRYASAVGGAISVACFDAFMAELGYDPTDEADEGDSPRALGNRIGHAVIAAFADDGANEAADYADPEAFLPDAPNLVVDEPGTPATEPTVWQRLVLAKAETQNGIPAAAGAQPYIGAHWGQVSPFSLVRPEPDAPYVAVGTPARELDDDLVDATVEVLRRTSELDADEPTTVDICPGALGNNALGADDGVGYTTNPVTREPYASQFVRRGDFGRVLAEFWADGPSSETPPGHWNTIANLVADSPELERRLFGTGETLDPLAWDVHVYLALNGAVHDAAIAAWELKRDHLTARPITLIRYMGQRGQRTEPEGPSYDPEGLPLVDGLIEVITEESSAPGERHAHLHRYVDDIAVRSWRGEPGDRKTEAAGVGWIRAVEWIPYQRRTFVTPAFPGYISGHSTFSRAAAVVLSGLTGSEAFPGGLGRQRFDPGYLFFEHGPGAPVTLEWATYFDAADQAGQSRLWGGIHVRQDDFDGRRTGAAVGASALDLAGRHFDGSAVP